MFKILIIKHVLFNNSLKNSIAIKKEFGRHHSFIIKKDGTLEAFDASKIIKAITKSASRVMYTFSKEE